MGKQTQHQKWRVLEEARWAERDAEIAQKGLEAFRLLNPEQQADIVQQFEAHPRVGQLFLRGSNANGTVMLCRESVVDPGSLSPDQKASIAARRRIPRRSGRPS